MTAWGRALAAVVLREALRFLQQTSRLASAVVRPVLWLVVFAAGFENVLGVSITPPYETYTTYDVYMLPGLIGMVLLFLWSVAFFYHLCNGIRHLFWDAGYGFDLKDAYRSGWIVVTISLVATILSWIVGLRLV